MITEVTVGELQVTGLTVCYVKIMKVTKSINTFIQWIMKPKSVGPHYEFDVISLESNLTSFLPTRLLVYQLITNLILKVNKTLLPLHRYFMKI